MSFQVFYDLVLRQENGKIQQQNRAASTFLLASLFEKPNTI